MIRRLVAANVLLIFLALNPGILSKEFNTEGKLKKVAILPFQNIEKNSSAEYLEASITDAVRDYLRGALAFEETPSLEVLRYARSNYYFQDELHTATSEIHLGFDMNQDIVIGGHYRLEQRKSGNQEVTYLITHVRILDIGQKRILNEFNIEGAADSRIFESIAEVSKRIAKEAASVLPSREEWEAEKFVVKNTYNSFALGGGLSYFSAPDVVYPVHLSYVRQGFFWHRLAFLLDAEGSFGSQKYTMDLIQLNEKTVSLSAIMAVGIHILDLKKIELKTFLGGGFHYTWYNLEYNYVNSASLPAKSKMDVYAPMAYAGILARIPLFANFYLDIHPYYKLLFYSGGLVNSMPGIQIGMAYHFH